MRSMGAFTSMTGRRGLAVAVGVYVAAFVALSLAGAGRSSLAGWLVSVLVIAAFVLLAVASWVLDRSLDRLRDDEQKRWRRLGIAVPAIMLLSGLSLVAWWHFGEPTDGWGLFGACLAFIGVGHLVSLLRNPRLHAGLIGSLLIVVVCGALFFVGLSGFVQGNQKLAFLALAGVLVSPVGLSCLTEDALASRLLSAGGVAGRWVAVASVVLVVSGGLLLVFWLDVPWRITLIGAVVAMVLVLAIASDTEVDVVIVAVAVAVIWSALPSNVPSDDAMKPSSSDVALVALGDSYMSGEGAQEYFDGTNDKGVNECRRAPTAYAHLVVELGDPGIPGKLAFLACSGAVASNIDAIPQYAGEPLKQPPFDDIDRPSEGLDQLAQLDQLISSSDVHVKLVIISIGGNDARFSEIGISCIAPGDCTQRGQQWLDHLNDVAPSVLRAYQAIRNAVGSEVPVLVVPYPVPISEHNCGYSVMSNNEHKFLNGFTEQLNGVVHRAATDAGFYYLKAMETAFKDAHLRICDGGPKRVGVNFIGMKSVRGLVEQVVNPANWFHSSFHPNKRGNKEMGNVLATWIHDHPNPSPKAEPDTDLGPPSVASLAEVMEQPNIKYCGGNEAGLSYCDRGPYEWAFIQAARFAMMAALPALLIVAGWWLTWLQLRRRSTRSH